MSKLEKLLILGIRSFDNQRSESIKFDSPLTLVVGPNGTGKTTIIECLKYATAGILPANSKTGGAWIHDPNLCGEKEVMAQVKLQFQSTTGARMVATRSLQLTVKKLTRSQKTLEGQLLFAKHGERSSISSRVAEMDVILPQYLGVSTAILDNVIFCHQDDSLWPLSESSNLKKKFDEIFEAQKYTKAIENIKQLRKKHNEELGKFKIIEQHAKEDKDRAVKVEKQSQRLSSDIEDLREKVETLKERIANAESLADKAMTQQANYARVLGSLEGKRIEANGKETTIRDLKQHLTEVPESDEWLQSTLDKFKTRLQQYEEEGQSKKAEYVQRQEHVSERRRHLDVKHREQGEFEHAKAENNRQIERRKDMIRVASAQHGLRGYDDLSDDFLIDDFMYKLRKLLKDQHTALDKAKTESNSGKREAQTQLNRLTARQSALRESKVAAKSEIVTNDRRDSEFVARLNKISIDEGGKAAIESRIEDVNAQLSKVRKTASDTDWDKLIKDANIELRSCEAESARLNQELIQGVNMAGELAKLSHIKQELKDRKRSLQTLCDIHTARLSKLLSHEWNPSSVEQLHLQAVNEAAQELSTSERNRDTVARELEQVQFKLKQAKDGIDKKSKEAKVLEEKVRSSLDGGEPHEYDEILSNLQSDLQASRNGAANSAALINYWQKILDVADPKGDAEHPTKGTRGVCRVCERPFTGAEDPKLIRMKNKLNALMRDVGKRVTDEQIKEDEARFQIAADAAVPLEIFKRLRKTEIPALEHEREQLSQQRQILTARIEDHDRIVEERRLAKSELDETSRPVGSIAKCQADIESLESQIQFLAAKQSQHGGARASDDIQQDITHMSEQAQAISKRISLSTADRDQSKAEMSRLELEASELRGNLITASTELDKKASLMGRVEEFKASNRKQRELIDKADQDIENLDPELVTAQAKYDDIAERGERQERELTRKTSELSDSLNSLDLINDQIRSYTDRGIPAQLTNTAREIKRIDQEIKTLESEQQDIVREINKIAKQLTDSENTKRQYSDNLRYRRESRALQELRAEITELETQNAEADRDRWQRESQKWSNTRNMLSGQQQGHIGEMKSKDVQLVELLADYETDLKDAAARYKEAHIRVETTKAAVEDLGRYGGALDKAVMKYHSLKMTEINRSIEELWQNTYQGTDVDTIMIKTDNESGKGNRSHSYRVVMVKQDAEMDMRGRCSAGQKVLASIIIRLALAESFGVNCGLIALDEPTTNLDRDNIRSLAESLHNIIKVRQAQSNFQLIVITHDEDFLRQMHCSDFTDWFYRVSRDERQKSIIERQSIAEVMN